ncbi:bleomycin resistance protein [Spirillospora sp. CA-294931]|uniref:bleomycin resistance protein n=1 Tax=Spirillospora sp. CA-294931 TaxID=3240042 RepID=UPI003D8C2C82
MGEQMIPLFPCTSVDETWDYYRALGFEQTFYQARPYPYLAVGRGDIQMQFAGIKGYEPSMLHSCYIVTTDVDTLYKEFRAGLKESLGRIPTRGLPRIGPLKDMSYGVRQFLLTDPSGNQLRIGQPIAETFEHRPVPKEKVAKALHTAHLFVDSKEDPAGAARILDHLLESDASPTTPELVQALVLRAAVALQLDELALARELVTRLRGIALTEAERAELADALLRLDDLEATLDDER